MSANATAVHSPVLKHHFNDLHQQHASERLGMWMFLVTEVLFFAGLFAAYTVYRYLYPVSFELGSSRLIVWIAAVNTLILVTSSLTMTLAIRSAQVNDRGGLIRNLLLTALLGTAFMGFKAYEYATDIHEHLVPSATGFEKSELHDEIVRNDVGKLGVDAGGTDASPDRVRLFLMFYYVMTGIHGVHLVIGIFCVLWLAVAARMGDIPPENYSTVEVVSLYWHLVDAIWLFLMPLLYLAGAGIHGHHG